jgi:hypothetical protein
VRAYDGPSVALLLNKFVDAFREMPALDNDPNAAYCYYVTYRPKALRVFKILEEVLLLYTEDLEKVDKHVFGGERVSISQTTDISL